MLTINILSIMTDRRTSEHLKNQIIWEVKQNEAYYIVSKIYQVSVSGK